MEGYLNTGYRVECKHKTWIFLYTYMTVLTLCFTLASTSLQRLNSVVLKVNSSDKQTLFNNLEKQNFRLIHEITPSTYIFEYNGNLGSSQNPAVLQSLLDSYHDQILDAERVRIYENVMRPDDTSTGEIIHTYHNDNVRMPDATHYGMGVPHAWSRGFSGNGVTIAVTGVGIDTDLQDLQRNIKLDLCYNYVNETSVVTPEIFHTFRNRDLYSTDHGNGVASVVAAIKGNNLCSAGIAFNATIVALKMYELRLPDGTQEAIYWTASDITSRTLVHMLDEIDIFVNAWTPTRPFDPLDLATREAITYGATMGRRGLGTIHTVPAGPVGNMFSSSIHTITVGKFGRNGSLPSDAFIDASIITSGLGEGHNLTSSFMVTASRFNKCSSHFKGLSAVVSQIAGIIGLGLQANPHLSLRDVQHLLVQASDRTGLEENIVFKRNGAGRYFHGMFGFGLLNADTFVTLAEERTSAPPLLLKTIDSSHTRITGRAVQNFELCYSCNVSMDMECLTTVEHVIVTVHLEAASTPFKMVLISPSETQSVIVDLYTDASSMQRQAKLVSVHFWDELAFGVWTVRIQSHVSSRKRRERLTHITNISITLCGTRNESEVNLRYGMANMCFDNVSSGINADTHTKPPPTKPPPPTAGTVAESKISIPLVVVLPLGIIISCSLMVFILIKGQPTESIPAYVSAPQKPQRQRHDSLLHRQISQLRPRERTNSNSSNSSVHSPGPAGQRLLRKHLDSTSSVHSGGPAGERLLRKQLDSTSSVSSEDVHQTKKTSRQ